MRHYRITPATERQTETALANLRDQFDARGGRISVGLDGRSFWVFESSEALWPQAAVDVHAQQIDITLADDAAFGSMLTQWANTSGVTLHEPPAPW